MLRSKTVLLVDDNSIHLYSLSKHLEEHGFEVMRASTASKALELAIEKIPAVILLDINLPDGSGFDICSELKARSATADIPIIFHSATTDTPQASATARELGAASFLTYPIDVDHLVAVLNAALFRSGTLKSRETSGTGSQL